MEDVKMTQPAVVFVSKDQVSYARVPLRPVQDGEVRIAVERFGICGAESRAVRGGKKGVNATSVRSGIVLGHEGVGRVVEVGPGVTDMHIGDRVAILSHIPCRTCAECIRGRTNHCMHLEHVGLTRDGSAAPTVVLPASSPTIFRIPDSIDEHAASLIEPLSCVLHGIRQLFPTGTQGIAGTRVFILGAGPIGMLWTYCCLFFGAEHVSVVDSNKSVSFLLSVIPTIYHPRVTVASAASACTAHADSAILANSDPRSYLSLPDALNPNGTVLCFSGLNGFAPELRPDGTYGFVFTDASQGVSPERVADIHYREYTQLLSLPDGEAYAFVGSTGYTTADIQDAVDILIRYPVFAGLIQNMITHNISLRDAAAVYQHFGGRAVLQHGEYDARYCVKVSVSLPYFLV